jgi:integrase
MARRRAGQIIELAPDKFKCVIFVGTVKGRNRYRSKTITGTYREAQDTLSKMLAEREAYSPHNLARKPLSVYAAHYLETTERTRRVRANTLAIMQSAFRADILPALGGKRLDSLRPHHIQTWVDSLASHHAPATVRQRYAYLRTMLNTAVTEGVLTKDPCPERIRLPKQGKREIKALTASQLSDLLGHASPGQQRALLTLLSSTGMRPSEARALTWDDLDTLTGELTISKSVDRFGNVAATKTSRVRRVTVPQSALIELTALPRDCELIFHNGFCKHLSANLPNLWFQDAAKSAGLKGYTVYSLRHTHVTLLIQSGVNITVVSQRVGHANPTMTLNIYSHLLPGLEAQAATQWEALYGTQNRVTN